MAREDGHEYNPETARDLRPKAFRFIAHGEEFRVDLQIPEYVLAVFDSELTARLQPYMENYCSTVVIDAMRGGYLHTDEGRKRMTHDVSTHLSNYIWERFTIKQEERGNESWETAPTLQRVHK
jgi:hypothetical protein